MYTVLTYALLGGNVVQGETLIKYYLPTYLPTCICTILVSCTLFMS